MGCGLGVGVRRKFLQIAPVRRGIGFNGFGFEVWV